MTLVRQREKLRYRLFWESNDEISGYGQTIKADDLIPYSVFPFHVIMEKFSRFIGKRRV